jgi:intracellular sulfur oxidation DsrE/DsrF family protein
MKQTLLIILFGVITLTTKAQTPANPMIKDYGTINAIDNVYMPDKNIDYKIAIDLKSSNGKFDEVNNGLNNVARLMNLHGVADIPKEQLHVAVVLHFTATPIVLNNDGYPKKYGVDNPNLELIKQLKDAGVEFYICGQSLVARKYAFEDVNPDVTIALSMITTVTEYMMKDYSLIVYE